MGYYALHKRYGGDESSLPNYRLLIYRTFVLFQGTNLDKFHYNNLRKMIVLSNRPQNVHCLY